MNQLSICQPSSSSSASSSSLSSSNRDIFAKTVEATRFATAKYRVNPTDDTPETKRYFNEQKARWRNHLQTYFDEHKTVNNERITWTYQIITTNCSKLDVCRNTWMAVYGVTKEDLDYAQK